VTRVGVVVSVGSDHHPFDRLIRWLDSWMDCRQPDVDLVVQYGTAARPRHGQAHDFMPHADLMALMSSAQVVVLQGGPMGILEARGVGRKPVVVPRLRALGEVVDDHQVPFCAEMAKAGEVFMAHTEAELQEVLDGLYQDPAEGLLTAPESSHIEAAARRFGELVVTLPPRRPLLPRALVARILGREPGPRQSRAADSLGGHP